MLAVCAADMRAARAFKMPRRACWRRAFAERRRRTEDDCNVKPELWDAITRFGLGVRDTTTRRGGHQRIPRVAKSPPLPLPPGACARRQALFAASAAQLPAHVAGRPEGRNESDLRPNGARQAEGAGSIQRRRRSRYLRSALASWTRARSAKLIRPHLPPGANEEQGEHHAQNEQPLHYSDE